MSRRRTRWAWIAGVVGALCLGFALLVLLWDWNWFRPLAERKAGATLERAVRIGDLDVQGWRRPTLVLSGIEVDNPEGFPGGGRVAAIERLEVTLDPAALLDHRLSLTRLHLERPQLWLLAPADASPNWLFPASSSPDEPPPLQLVLGQLSIAQGQIQFEHPGIKSAFAATVFTQPGARPEEPELHVEASGRYAAQPLRATFVGGSLLSLREVTDPYPVSLDAANGPTRLRLKGSLLDPLHFAGARLSLRFEGADMAALYPLTGVPLPATAPYSVEGQLDVIRRRGGDEIRFSKFSGKVGGSDLSGSLALRTGGPRPHISGEMHSDTVLLADLAGFIGGQPGTEDAEGMSAAQKAKLAKQEASPRVLPDTPINLPKLRGADFDLHYTARRIQSTDTPFDELSAQLRVDDGVLSLRPLSFGVGEGRIATNLLLDGTGERVKVNADADFQRVDFGRILSKTSAYRGAGRIGGRVNLVSQGNTVADLLGAGNGKVRLSMAGGDVSALMVNLAGLDFGNALLSAMGIPSRAELRCMIADLDLKDGLLGTELLLMDTTEAKVIGTGTVNLKTEVLDYQIRTQPKTLNLGSIGAPINIRGTLKNPTARPDAKSLAIRGGAAVALAVVAAPLAALLPTLQLGQGKDADCEALLRQVRGEAAQLPRAPDLPSSEGGDAGR